MTLKLQVKLAKEKTTLRTKLRFLMRTYKLMIRQVDKPSLQKTSSRIMELVFKSK